MEAPMINIGFIGFGLIGASIAKSVKAKAEGKYVCHVYDYHTEENPVMDKAVSEGVIADWSKNICDLLDCDMLILCAPVLKNVEYLKTLKAAADEAGKKLPLITDVGSVKGNMVRAAAELGIGDRFLGAHPMAGSEKTGYDNATDHLLENAYYIITPSEHNSPEQIILLKDLIQDVGALPIMLEPEEHDRITAVISHVPHIVAAELVNLVMNAGDDTEKMRLLAAGGFKDITRIASSSPGMWRSIFIANKDAIMDTLDRFQDALVKVEAAVITGNGDYIYDDIKNAGEFRDSIPNSRGMFKASYKIYIDIEDKIGAIATIATMLVVSGISIKNIGIVHNRSYEQGVLRIEFYDAESMENAVTALESHSYTVYRND